MSGAFVNVNVTGVDEILKELEQRLSPSKVTRVSNQALRIVGRYGVVKLKEAVRSYRDTGATYTQVTATEPRKSGGGRMIKIGWSGDGNRWKLVHLNEFGYTRFGKTYSPRGLGKIQGVEDDLNTKASELVAHELKVLAK